MNIPEVKRQIQNYSSAELQILVVGLYKSLPKKIRDSGGIDEFLKNPSAHGGRTPKKAAAVRSMDEIEGEANEFIDNAEAGFYGSPNRIISKSERPKWRFVVKRLYKEIALATKESGDAQRAAVSLERLYKLLCAAGGRFIFNSYDVFESVGITQYDFFVRVLELHKAGLSQRDFLEKAVALLVENSLDRYTLQSELMRGIITFLSTPDMKYLAIETAGRMHRDAPEPTSKLERSRRNYEWAERENDLCEFVCRCYCELAEYDNALDYFARKYRRDSDEVKLYVLVRLLINYDQAGRIVQVISEAVKKGITPRESLLRLKAYIETHASFPEHVFL